MTNKKLLLTSAGLTNTKLKNTFLELVTDFESVSIAILSTKFQGNASNIFSLSIESRFQEMGYKDIKIFDLEDLNIIELMKYNVFFVCGGNTFKILDYARKINLKAGIENLFDRNGVYVGVSAGSIIVGPNINIANEVEPDPNEIDLQDLTGLNILDQIICPHYTENQEGEVLKFEEKYIVSVMRLTDNNALKIDGNKIEKI